MTELKIINIDETNMIQYPPTCFLNPKNEGYQIKSKWLKDRFSEGMKIKLLYVENEKKCNGFIEYVPGEFAWRAVDAKGYMFILRELLSFFVRQGSGKLAMVCYFPGDFTQLPLCAASSGAFRGTVDALSTLYQNENITINGFRISSNYIASISGLLD